MSGPAGPPGSAAVFTLLEQDLATTGLTVRDSDARVAAGPVALLLEAPSRRSMLLPLTDSQTPVTDTGSAGVTLRGRELLDHGSLTRYQSVSCDDPRLHPTFSSLCDEILALLPLAAADGTPAAEDVPGTEPPDPGPAALQVLERWRDLLATGRQRLLGAPALAGILAELHLLELLTAAHGSDAALHTWVAPQPGRHDFHQAGTAVEVKATTGHTRFRVAIHGLTQLQPPDDGTLHLYAEQLEPLPDGADSVPGCLDRLAGTGAARRELLERLAPRGYAAVDETAYRTVRFTPLATACLPVNADLPALTPAALNDPTLADRVLDVSYSLDLIGAAADTGTPPKTAALVRLMGPA